MTADQFTADSKAWIEAVSAVLDVLIVKVGILIIAAFGLVKTFRTQDTALRAELDSLKERQDRQGKRITDVALSVPGVGEPQKVEVVNEANNPVPVEPTP